MTDNTNPPNGRESGIDVDRRKVLAGTGVALTGFVAGCNGDGGEGAGSGGGGDGGSGGGSGDGGDGGSGSSSSGSADPVVVEETLDEREIVRAYGQTSYLDYKVENQGSARSPPLRARVDFFGPDGSKVTEGNDPISPLDAGDTYHGWVDPRDTDVDIDSFEITNIETDGPPLEEIPDLEVVDTAFSSVDSDDSLEWVLRADCENTGDESYERFDVAGRLTDQNGYVVGWSSAQVLSEQQPGDTFFARLQFVFDEDRDISDPEYEVFIVD